MVTENLLEASDKTRGVVALEAHLGSIAVAADVGAAIRAVVMVVFGEFVIVAAAG